MLKDGVLKVMEKPNISNSNQMELISICNLMMASILPKAIGVQQIQK